MRARLRYWFDNTMARGTPALIALLGIATLIMLIVVSLYLLAIEPTNMEGDPRTAGGTLWESLIAVLGFYFAPLSGSWQVLVAWLLLGLGGLFITSTFIGVISTGLSNKLEELRRGRSHVVEKGHAVLLGWSDQVFMLLDELATANAGRRTVAVVLAQQDKAEMEDAIRARLGKTRLRVVCRTGSPLDPQDLEIVNPRQAGSIMVLTDPQDPDFDVQVIKTLLAVGECPGPIVACVQSSDNVDVARLAGASTALVLDVSEITARLLVQTARRPGLFDIYVELLDFDGCEIYLRREPALVGSSYQDTLLAYENLTVMGVVPPDGKPVLNPPMSTVITAEHTLILIDENEAAKPLSPVAVAGPAGKSSSTSRSRRRCTLPTAIY